jgi:hypothetical protein
MPRYTLSSAPNLRDSELFEETLRYDSETILQLVKAGNPGLAMGTMCSIAVYAVGAMQHLAAEVRVTERQGPWPGVMQASRGENALSTAGAYRLHMGIPSARGRGYRPSASASVS